ncbi:unnamed protein product [Bursaphelenchus xylophilus]|nr:unnamed protein product [Bursaphelenchus xylophilus]CAG9111188.1 unnamed protein product [Bursaphelenchus xylophilus]
MDSSRFESITILLMMLLLCEGLAQTKPVVLMKVSGDLCADCLTFFESLKPTVDVLYRMAGSPAFEFGVQRAIKNNCDNVFRNITGSKNLCRLLDHGTLTQIVDVIETDRGIDQHHSCNVLAVCTN